MFDQLFTFSFAVMLIVVYFSGIIRGYTGISIRISIATAWTGPKRIAKAGTVNKADPNPV